MPLTSLVTVLSVLLFFALAVNVGRARAKYGIEAPATSGNPAFERVFRVHYNTMEVLVMHLPALWLFAYYLSDRWAAGLGCVWIVGRIMYAAGYYAEASKRGAGAIVSMGATFALLIGALVGVVLALLK